MPTKKGKLPPIKSTNLVLRIADTSKPLRVVIATENPVQRWDEETKQVVNEVLLMDGVEFRGGRNQIPIVDSHNDKTVRNIFGSIRGIQIDHGNGELYGVPEYASDNEAQIIRSRMEEGHITDFSITAQPLETIFVPKGSAYTTSRGMLIEGPALIHKRWQPHNASICATGADEDSTVRRSYTDLNRKVIRMDEALLSQLSAMGLPEGMTDPNQVLAWVVGKLSPQSEPESVESMAEELPIEEAKPVENMDGSEVKPEEKPLVEQSIARSAKEAGDLIKRALEADQKRRNEIQAACKLAKVERAFADELCDAGVSVNVARQRIIERMATQPLGSSVGADVRITESEDDKFFAAARDGLLMRASTKKQASYAAGSEDFRYASLMDFASAFATRMGAKVERMPKREVALLAMGQPGAMNRHRVQRDVYHSTGSFTNLLLDAANKTLLNGYEEAAVTWDVWARTAPSVPDFKNINRIRFSESPDLDMVPELHPYPESAMSDSKETYKVEKFGKMFSVSWETVINDDLDAISRVPAMHGAAARRTQNKKVYEVLTSNPTMSDTYELFSSSHASGSNVSGAAAAPSVTTLNAAFVKMRKQKGLNTNVTLNVMPKYLIVPVAYEANGMELFSSVSYNASNNNEGVRNIYGPGGSRQLILVSDPVLDASSATDWYLAADSMQTDTVELAFLQGEESPVLESEWDFAIDGYKNKVRQTFGVKAIDWRGLFRNSA